VKKLVGKVGCSAAKGALDALDSLEWRLLPVVPNFRRPPEGFVPALATTWMTPSWIRSGCSGYNFWTMPLPQGPGRPSARYDPGHPLFQTWICVYLIRKLVGGKGRPFGFTQHLEPVPERFLALGQADQKAWLWMMGASWAPVRIYDESVGSPATLGETKTTLARAKMRTHADVGPDNPVQTRLLLSFRAPHAMPAEMTRESFLPRWDQWRGKIRPYQEIEYTVHGFPIALPEYGLSAYLFYAGAKYDYGGRVVDSFENVRSAAAPILEDGIEFIERGRACAR
jgi:hypothetical protein